MNFFSIVILLFSVAVCFAVLNSTDGDNVTISFKTAELERADQVRIVFTREEKKTRIAQYCRCPLCGDCSVLEEPGVLLRVEEGILILLNVSSENSGLYEAEIFVGSKVTNQSFTLNVNKRPQTSISEPPNSSERQRLYVLIALVVFIFVVLGLFLLQMLEGR